MHNVDFDDCASGTSSPFNHSCISVSNCTGNIFWGSKCATNNCAPLSNCSGTLTAGWYIGTLSAATDIQMYDNGGANTTIENSIFHNYILKDKKELIFHLIIHSKTMLMEIPHTPLVF
ncbi:MAG: hypothetical protein IPL74_17340 [Bacteroidetes bacterium]|nr:hypothetical protein [Bacteroidota bacterium]